MQKKRRTQFLKKPEFDGDKQAFDEFIAKELTYPAEATEKGAEGNVHVGYSVNEKGDVVEAKIKRGIGFGCDEEALRVVRLLKFRAARNAGAHITIHSTIVIRFRLQKKAPELRFVYEYKPSVVQEAKPIEPPPKTGVSTFTLTFSAKPSPKIEE